MPCILSGAPIYFPGVSDENEHAFFPGSLVRFPALCGLSCGDTIATLAVLMVMVVARNGLLIVQYILCKRVLGVSLPGIFSRRPSVPEYSSSEKTEKRASRSNKHLFVGSELVEGFVLWAVEIPNTIGEVVAIID